MIRKVKQIDIKKRFQEIIERQNLIAQLYSEGKEIPYEIRKNFVTCDLDMDINNVVKFL